MTLLEALLALVILGVSAVGYLDVYQASARSVRDSAEWTQVVALAESAMEGATLGDALQAQQAMAGVDGGTRAAGYTQAIAVRPWRDGVREIVVTVTSPRGTTFTLRRLARERRP
jgi:Tfp pilus assembly protein PilV